MSSYQVLARKWRPARFSEVKGQDHVVKTLQNSILNNRLASAYLFSGSRGVGKTSVARLLAKSICCDNPQEGREPCNECTSCREITNSSSIDIQEIDGASNNGVDSIREIRENIAYPPVSSKYKIYIIDEVHMLSTSAFNALLKTLEEPPEHGLFIFATTEPHKIPQTIVSRCQNFDFKRLSVEDIVSVLSNIIEKESIKVSNQALYLIAREARGSLRDSLSILDQVVSFTGNNVDVNEVKEILGFVDRNIILDIVKSIVEKNPRNSVTLSRKLFREAYDVKRVSDTLVEIFRELLFIKHGLHDLLVSDLPDYELKELEEIASKTSIIDVEQWFYMANTNVEEVARSSYPSLIFEVALLSMCNKPENRSIEELIQKFRQPLEKKNEITHRSSSLNWDELLKIVLRRDPELGNILSKGKFIGVQQGRTVVIDYSDHPDLILQFSKRSEFLKLIQDTIHELCGNVYKIDIRSNALMQEVADSELKKNDLLNKEIIKSAVDDLGATVKDVKLF